MTQSTRVFAITLVRQHTCSHYNTRQADSDDGDPSTGQPEEAKHHETFTLRRDKADRSITSSQLVHVLRNDYELARKINKPWSLKECRAQIMKYDEGASGTAGLVLRKLRSFHSISIEVELELIQGLACELRRLGFGVALHLADATAVKYQVCTTPYLQRVHLAVLNLRDASLCYLL